MARALLIAWLTIAATGCVLDSSHVSTRLYAVCTEDVLLPFDRVSATLSAARVTIEDVGAQIDDPDARATLDEVVLEAFTGIDDFTFAEAMTMDLVAPGAGLPDARVAETSDIGGASPLRVAGDSSVDLVGYLTAETLEVRIDLIGDAPNDFAVMLDACLDVEGIEITDDVE